MPKNHAKKYILAALLLLHSSPARMSPCQATAQEPAPTGTADTLYSQLSIPGTAVRNQVLGLISSAQSSIYASSWTWSDPSIISALNAQAQLGTKVHILYHHTGGTATATNRAMEALRLSGGSCYGCQSTTGSASLHNRIADNFLEADGVITAYGNWIYSGSAVQAGHYLDTWSGYTHAKSATTQFVLLASAGTLLVTSDHDGRDTEHLCISPCPTCPSGTCPAAGCTPIPTIPATPADACTSTTPTNNCLTAGLAHDIAARTSLRLARRAARRLHRHQSR